MKRLIACLLLSFVGSAMSADSIPLTPEQLQGKMLFEATCNYCHNPRGWGTERLKTRVSEERAVLVDRTDLDPAYIRTVVRNGLVSMPAYTPTDLSEAQIKAIAAYLTRAGR